MAIQCDFDALSVLLQASSKDVVLRICNESFINRDKQQYSESVLASVGDVLSLDTNKSRQLVRSLGALLKTAVFHGDSNPSSLQSLFPSNFHKNLRDLLVKTMMENMNNWRNSALNNQVSLPRLVDFDWRVDIKTSSDTITRMSVPTCVLQMKVQENATEVDKTPEVEHVNVELSKETLDTMLDGLSKIRDQLSSVAKR
ncbi:COMM domain-containing protein 9-like isoform X2 [Mizuhopecten yessoensis]|uniref:COMM domain-containing protein 9 n=1 Tax=Mizuhopecten yessoensis TaxID=6573 RepID=A0A210QGW9_MIZYE|nr:COMM domain-containing protein 9-like isoform X2 [Mizuhopecten yessoensis]OWF47966.1 COMM domain-containing protein 9 [Mizuhopecten yessoensis]